MVFSKESKPSVGAKRVCDCNHDHDWLARKSPLSMHIYIYQIVYKLQLYTLMIAEALSLEFKIFCMYVRSRWRELSSSTIHDSRVAHHFVTQ